MADKNNEFKVKKRYAAVKEDKLFAAYTEREAAEAEAKDCAVVAIRCIEDTPNRYAKLQIPDESMLWQVKLYGAGRCIELWTEGGAGNAVLLAAQYIKILNFDKEAAYFELIGAEYGKNASVFYRADKFLFDLALANDDNNLDFVKDVIGYIVKLSITSKQALEEYEKSVFNTDGNELSDADKMDIARELIQADLKQYDALGIFGIRSIRLIEEAILNAETDELKKGTFALRQHIAGHNISFLNSAYNMIIGGNVPKY